MPLVCMLLFKYQEQVPACRSYILRHMQLAQAKWCGAKMLKSIRNGGERQMEGKTKAPPS